MAKKGGDDWGAFIALLLIAGGTIAYIYTKSGRAEENATLIPDRLEGKIDLVVKKLNDRFGKQWVDAGLNALKSYLQQVLPAPVVEVVDAMYAVEQLSRGSFWPMTGPAKRQAAIQRTLTA
jgi:hypothetical protein